MDVFTFDNYKQFKENDFYKVRNKPAKSQKFLTNFETKYKAFIDNEKVKPTVFYDDDNILIIFLSAQEEGKKGELILRVMEFNPIQTFMYIQIIDLFISESILYQGVRKITIDLQSDLNDKLKEAIEMFSFENIKGKYILELDLKPMKPFKYSDSLEIVPMNDQMDIKLREELKKYGGCRNAVTEDFVSHALSVESDYVAIAIYRDMNKNMVGICVIYPRPYLFGGKLEIMNYIELICTYFGGGVYILKCVEEYTKDIMGVNYLLLSSVHGAYGFYKYMGFEQTLDPEIKVFEDTSKLIPMYKKLEEPSEIVKTTIEKEAYPLNLIKYLNMSNEGGFAKLGIDKKTPVYEITPNTKKMINNKYTAVFIKVDNRNKKKKDGIIEFAEQKYNLSSKYLCDIQTFIKLSKKLSKQGTNYLVLGSKNNAQPFSSFGVGERLGMLDIVNFFYMIYSNALKFIHEKGFLSLNAKEQSLYFNPEKSLWYLGGYEYIDKKLNVVNKKKETRENARKEYKDDKNKISVPDRVYKMGAVYPLKDELTTENAILWVTALEDFPQGDMTNDANEILKNPNEAEQIRLELIENAMFLRMFTRIIGFNEDLLLLKAMVIKGGDLLQKMIDDVIADATNRMSPIMEKIIDGDKAQKKEVTELFNKIKMVTRELLENSIKMITSGNPMNLLYYDKMIFKLVQEHIDKILKLNTLVANQNDSDELEKNTTIATDNKIDNTLDIEFEKWNVTAYRYK